MPESTAYIKDELEGAKKRIIKKYRDQHESR